MELPAAGTDKTAGLVEGSWTRRLAAEKRRNFETINRKSESSCPVVLGLQAD